MRRASNPRVFNLRSFMPRRLHSDVRCLHTPSRDDGPLRGIPSASRRHAVCRPDILPVRTSTVADKWNCLGRLLFPHCTVIAQPSGAWRKGDSDDTLYAESRRCGSRHGLASLRSARNPFPSECSSPIAVAAGALVRRAFLGRGLINAQLQPDQRSMMSGGYGRRGRPAQTLSRAFSASRCRFSNSLSKTIEMSHNSR